MRTIRHRTKGVGSKRPDLGLLLHPARIRILHAFAGGQARTTSELCDRLPDVSQASVYRHVALLVDAGVLEVTDEQLIRGALERRYRLNLARSRIGPDDAARMTIDDHRNAFTAAMAALLADFGAYLDSGGADPSRDRVGYRQIPLWLSDAEHRKLTERLQRLLWPMLAHRPRAGRRAYLLSPIVFPIPQPAHRKMIRLEERRRLNSSAGSA